MTFTIFKQTCRILALVFVTGLVAVQAQAADTHPPIAPTPCDPAYFESLKSQAWEKAQIQVTQNQNQIYKPDSVLEYTCFNKFVGVMAKDSKNEMTGTERWGKDSSSEKLTTDLNATVGDTQKSYLDTFPTKSGGGHYDVEGDRGAGGDDAIKEESYNCDMMNKVWQTAKCEDFMADPTTSGFATDSDYAKSDDKRTLPAACARDARWPAMETTAKTAPPWKDNPPDPKTTKKLTVDDCGSADYPPVALGTNYPSNSGVPKACEGKPAKNCKLIPQCHYNCETDTCVKD